MGENIKKLSQVCLTTPPHQGDWQGKEYQRDSEDYQKLLDIAYDALFQNEGFRRALIASGDAVLTHSIGKTDPKVTVLTRSEFCGRLMRLRAALTGK